MARFSTLPIDAQLAFADVGDADLGDLAAAVERAQAALDALPQGDALRVKLMITFKHILTFVRFRQAQDHPRPALCADRWKYVTKLKADSKLRPLRAAAFDAIGGLLDTVWPVVGSSTERSRKARRDPEYRDREQLADTVSKGLLRLRTLGATEEQLEEYRRDIHEAIAAAGAAVEAQYPPGHFRFSSRLASAPLPDFPSLVVASINSAFAAGGELDLSHYALGESIVARERVAEDMAQRYRFLQGRYREGLISHRLACYSGEVDGGRPHGFGVVIWPCGASYEGQWKAGQIEGHGRLTRATAGAGPSRLGVDDEWGLLPAGEWTSAMVDASSERARNDHKAIMEGEWVAGSSEGPCLFISTRPSLPDGYIEISRYEADKPVGENAMWSLDGQRAWTWTTEDHAEEISLERAAEIAARIGVRYVSEHPDRQIGYTVFDPAYLC